MFRSERLPNGLRVLGIPDETAQTLAMGYFVATGARDEQASEMGVSHFLEHLLFKGSDRIPAGELNARFDALGANVNAFTSEEATVYHAACLPESWRELLLLLTELMRPALRPEDVETERGVILEEIAMYADQPDSRAFDELRLRAWGDHPLGHLVLGTPETVAALTPGVLRSSFEARYGTSSTMLVACGRFDWDALLREAETLTSGWPAGGFTRPVLPSVPEGGLDVLPDPRLARAQFTMLAPAYSVHDPRREAAVVLAEILGGENGRLYWALVDTGLADDVDLSHVEFTDNGTFEGAWSCDPSRAAQTLEVVRGELHRVQEEGVTEAEVRRARRKLAVSLVLRTETPYGRLFALGMDALYLGTPRTLDESVARFEAVTVADVGALLAERPFDRSRILALGPLDPSLRLAEARSRETA